MKDFLTEKEKDLLIRSHKKERNLRIGDRIKAVLMSNNGLSYTEIARHLLIEDSTVGRHIKEYKESKKLSLASGGSESKLNGKNASELAAHIQQKTYMTTAKICLHVKKKYGLDYTVNGMTAWLHRNGFSYKKPKPTPAKADRQKQANFIETYKKLVTTLPKEEPLLFGDAVHPTMATKVTYGWIKTGSDKQIKTTASRTRMNIMGTLNLKEMKLLVASYLRINSESMVNYFDRLKQEYPDAVKINLVLDCGPYNTSKQTRKAAKERGIILHYLPPYSPNLNPIERVWKVMNEHVRNNRFFVSAKEFRDQINNFFNVTWKNISYEMKKRINDNFETLDPAV